MCFILQLQWGESLRLKSFGVQTFSVISEHFPMPK